MMNKVLLSFTDSLILITKLCKNCTNFHLISFSCVEVMLRTRTCGRTYRQTDD